MCRAVAAVLALALLLLASPAPALAGDDVAEDLAARSLSQDPVVRAAAEAEYEKAPVETKMHVLVAIAKRLKAASERRLDALIDLALDSEGEKRADAIRALAEAGAAAVERLVARLGEAPRRAPDLPAPAGEEKRIINLEFWVHEVPPAIAEEFLKRDSSGPRAALAYLEKADVERFLKAVGEGSGAKAVAAPKITVYHGQRANVDVLEQISYIQDYDVEVGMGGAQVADPIIGTIHEGIVLEATPHVSDDMHHVTLELELTLAKVKRPIPEHEATIGDREVKIQLPEVVKKTVRSTVSIPSGGHVLVGGLESPEGKDAPRVVLLVRAEAFDISNEPAFFGGKR